MKFDKRSSGDSGFKPGASTGIIMENYVDRAQAFIRSNGGEGFVIRSIAGANGSAERSLPATEPQWISWVNWFASKKIAINFALSNGMMTVPTEWPESFDATADYSDRGARLPPLKKSPANEDRAGILARETERLARRGISIRSSRRREPEPQTQASSDPYRYRSVPCAPLGSYVAPIAQPAENGENAA